MPFENDQIERNGEVGGVHFVGLWFFLAQYQLVNNL